MRSRLLLARAAALILAAGGLLVIPASPASAHCGLQHIGAPDQYNNGGIAFAYVHVRYAPHSRCDPFTISYYANRPNIFCAKQVPDNPNDWIYFVHYGDGEWGGWVREREANVHDGDRWVARCETRGLVHITQNP